VQPLKWLTIILVYAAVTSLCAFVGPSDSAFGIGRIVLAFTYVAFLPGYCFLNLFFAEGKLDFPEILVLSVALSFSIAGVSGLFLGISPIGINTTSITVALSVIVVVLAGLAYLRKVRKIKFQLRRSKKLSPITV
jgi:uncharacterized membrane protein